MLALNALERRKETKCSYKFIQVSVFLLFTISIYFFSKIEIATSKALQRRGKGGFVFASKNTFKNYEEVVSAHIKRRTDSIKKTLCTLT